MQASSFPLGVIEPVPDPVRTAKRTCSKVQLGDKSQHMAVSASHELAVASYSHVFRKVELARPLLPSTFAIVSGYLLLVRAACALFVSRTPDGV